MKMTDGVEWAIHCATVLAVLPPRATLPARALAEFHGVSESYLLKHLQALTSAGVLESVPGPKGGYRLARPANEITLLDIVEAAEGREPAFRCTEIRQRGPVPATAAACRVPCAITAAMLKAEAAWKESLRRQTIADLLVQLGSKLDPVQVGKATAWIADNRRS
jgi:Rrf2 family protein